MVGIHPAPKKYDHFMLSFISQIAAFGLSFLASRGENDYLFKKCYFCKKRISPVGIHLGLIL
jgi:hypothetical protein